jgi:hypothetical protein
MRWADHVAGIGEKRGAYRVLVRKPEVKRPLGRPKGRQDNIKIDIQEVGLLGMGLLAGSCGCSNESTGSIKCGDFLDYLRTYLP